MYNYLTTLQEKPNGKKWISDHPLPEMENTHSCFPLLFFCWHADICCGYLEMQVKFVFPVRELKEGELSVLHLFFCPIYQPFWQCIDSICCANKLAKSKSISSAHFLLKCLQSRSSFLTRYRKTSNTKILKVTLKPYLNGKCIEVVEHDMVGFWEQCRVTLKQWQTKQQHLK